MEAEERAAQLSLGRAGTLARAGSSRVYMSIPRRNTASCSRSSWSCSSTGVWFMGEKPRAGTPACRGKEEPLGERPAPGATALPTLLQAAHRAEEAAVSGSGEDLQIQSEVPAEGRAGGMGRRGAREEAKGRRTVGGSERKERGNGEWRAGRDTHMSLQTPLNAAHQGSESSVDVTRGSVHFWEEEGYGGVRTGPGHLVFS